MRKKFLGKDMHAFLRNPSTGVAMVRVFLGNNADGKADVAGMTAGYRQFFGTKDQPNKPARTTLQVVLPAATGGALVEIDMVAVRSK